MARLIDADALMESLCDELGEGEVLYRIPPDAIDEAPTIEAAPVVHGRWEGPFRVDVNHNGYKCSKCGFWGVPGWIACPKCAARMDGDGNA